ncbi:MAG: hypothetical protein B7Y31_02505 [Novosphingobium sp. 16-62-11]|uniref:DUF1993 domain-containing protein n=1 Tax=Novosphingobium sp. 17-62-19 TaxID=1970406 RepID=UPI000BC47833|nr:DUF1993 domain-containing protein [Novosphingobium sp. 17-62-19]OYZ44548.1 MAG: hypothetical protein B7Y31_02505 [Novosphingobium sp. 16-62-11]OZA21762.1 MAG: hypothetical protein B7X90_00200 [Novosphingobium sp. 17-62-19]OZA71965.1 MAG: hypothetical protein B7X78_02245 [Sphingomonadales bacterium 39-62-4]HQS94882.1 DUF1993 domain-containing protein [Novosphingobium sp.]
MTPASLLAPTYVQMLGALSQWLGKAESQLSPGEADALLSARLASDMFPLSTQIRFACVQAHEGMFRLAGEDFPPSVEALLTAGRSADEHPGTIADAKACIDETVALVQSMSECTGTDNPERPIAHTLPMGIVFDFTAEQYARDWAIGQFYFHVMTAYAILRSQGIDLGKADYVAHLFPYARPGTLPQG